MHRKALKFAAEAALILAITALLLEISSRALLCWRGDCHLPAIAFYEKARRTFARNASFEHFTPVPDPFFGYVAGEMEANNAGFFSAVDFPYRKKDNEYVIGVFGGSLAMQVFAEIISPELRNEFERVPWLKGRSLVWLNFSMGCMRQPQQFIIASFYNDTLDLSLNLDGYNEVAIHHRGSPAAEPCYYRELFADPANAKEHLLRVSAIREWHSRATDIIVNQPSFLHSAFLHLAWNSLHAWGERKIQVIREIDRPKLNLFPETEEQEGEALVRNWEKFTLLQSNIASQTGLPSFFFLQPNQHLKGSKPLAPEELKLWEHLPDLPARSARIHRRMTELKKAAARLKDQGVNTIDLTEVFIRHPEPLYADDCCHVNIRGARLLARRMVGAIVDQMLAGKTRQPIVKRVGP